MSSNRDVNWTRKYLSDEFAYRLMKGPGFMAVIAFFFLTPKSRILKRFGTERECSHELPTLYHIENKCIQFTPHPQVRQLPPQQLTSTTEASRLPTLRLITATHSSWCLEAFHCSSAGVAGGQLQRG